MMFQAVIYNNQKKRKTHHSLKNSIINTNNRILIYKY